MPDEQRHHASGATGPSAPLLKADARPLRRRSSSSGSLWGLRSSDRLEGAARPLYRAGWCRHFKKCIIIDPSRSARLAKWDSLVFVTLALTAFAVPYEAAFDSIFEPLNAWIVGVFLVDMCLQFVTAFPHPEHPSSFVKSPRRIVKRYLTTWFIVDTLSVFPTSLLFRCIGAQLLKGSRWKCLQLLRLLRLLRLTHVRHLVRRWHTSFGLSNAAVSLLKLVGFTALWCHCMACLWGFIARDAAEHSWLTALQKAKDAPSETYLTNRCIYGISLYWAIMTFTTIGYGDVTPQNEMEYWIASLSMTGMAGIWAFTISQIIVIATSLMQQDTRFKETMDGLNWLMEDRGVPHPLRQELRRYLHETRDCRRQQEQKAIVDQMSPMLQGELSMHLHKQWIGKVWYLRSMPREIVVRISRCLSSMVYAPSEHICRDRALFIVRRGMCIRKGRILLNGDVWGEDMVLSNEHLREHLHVRCVTYLEVLMLEFLDLDEILQSFPEDRAKLRWVQIRIAMRHAFVKIARALRDYGFKQGMHAPELSDWQKKTLVHHVLRGSFTGQLEEESPLERQIEQCISRAERELTFGRVVTPFPLTDEGADRAHFRRQHSSGREQDSSALELHSLRSCMAELTMKVDCLLIKDRSVPTSPEIPRHPSFRHNRRASQ